MNAGALRLVLGDQLTRELASLRDLDPARDVVLMVEVADEATYVPHHPQKIAFLFSAMRHFAQALRDEGVTVDYVTLEATGNTGSFDGELRRAVIRHAPSRIVLTEPGEWRVLDMMQAWQSDAALPAVELRDDDRFLCSRGQFAQWMQGRRAPRMEYFYRDLRRRTGWLMEGEAPVGGDWNYDADNRQPLPAHEVVPVRLRFVPDAITVEVLALVARRFGHHFGTLEGFGWGVTRADAEAALEQFIAQCLPRFGDYQDAMRRGDPWLFHGVISTYLNAGLLVAREVCEAALAAWRAGHAPLNAVEGFIRQILGWREYVRGLYWQQGRDYGASNGLQATRPLPGFFWTADTNMACLRECLADTRDRAYAHHIQRLMVIGNFALLAGLAPREVQAWYLAVYADAYEWVELPNVHGMVLHADGGLLGSKPYAASGAYIDRMSDYCGHCVYRVKDKTGPRACPFNALYWDFLDRNEARLGGNPRMAMPYRTLAKMTAERREQIRADAAAFLDGLA
jgi:deoxyribodipyrimidine photolyase-related protein